ncbi:hypothetical protein B5U27_07525 [Pseudomonas amygdali pv. lachrymans]|nr:hypothetical protein B5U27_07525 [Pseudomonas amygdali pv. lachrymans]
MRHRSAPSCTLKIGRRASHDSQVIVPHAPAWERLS